MANRNLTIQLDEETIREAKVLAAEEGTSVSALVAHQIHRLTAAHARYQDAMSFALESMRAAASSGRAAPQWSREELHDRW